MRPLITLTTDFGTRDGYAASMKGVILGIAPEAVVVDITHEIAPGDVRAGAFILMTTSRDFPPGTIHVAVVDPGVGTARKALAVRTARSTFLGPDNGLLSWALRAEGRYEAESIENPRFMRPSVSATFHGRDIFAPAAAHLALGAPFQALGPVVAPREAPWITPTPRGEDLEGEVIHVDRFGNAVTNLALADLLARAPLSGWSFEAGGVALGGLVATYGAAEPGVPLVLTGSAGLIEVAVSRGSAAEILGLRPGSPVFARRAARP